MTAECVCFCIMLTGCVLLCLCIVLTVCLNVCVGLLRQDSRRKLSLNKLNRTVFVTDGRSSDGNAALVRSVRDRRTRLKASSSRKIS